MKKNLFFLAILLFMAGSFFTSCEKEDELSNKNEILAFVFEASKNASLEHNVIGTISGTEVVAEVPFGTSIHNLIPDIEVSPKATINPPTNVSTDFSGPVSYVVTAEDGSTKTFTVNVPVAPAPYIGMWETETSVNIENLGLSRVKIVVNAAGELTMELKSTISGSLFGQSIQGKFDPESVCNTEICLNQTHRWLDDQWTPETNNRCIMYACTGSQMVFKYCQYFPRNQWWFTVNLVKIE
jgi:hypothetical protein